MNTEKPVTKRDDELDEGINIKDILFLCLANWKWFVLSIVVMLGIGIFYVLKTQPKYTRTMEILIKDNRKGGSFSRELNDFSNMGLFQSINNINNELIAIKSPSIMADVVKRMKLDINYYTPGSFHDNIAYGSNLPIEVVPLDLKESESASFIVNMKEDESISISKIILNGEEIEAKDVIGAISDTISTPVGRIIVLKSDYYQAIDASYIVRKSTMFAAIGRCSASLSAVLSSKDAAVIRLTYEDLSYKRAEDILEQVVEVYNEKWVEDKNQVAVSTSHFINERLALIESDLGNVDNSISSFKSQNLLPDIQAASNLYMTQSSQTNQQILTLSNQLTMAKYIKTYLDQEANKFQLLPANSGIGSTNIESQISSYNTQMLQRNSLVANSSTKNPLVVDLDNALLGLRKAIITSIDNQIITLETQINSLQKADQQTTARIAANPDQAKYLLSVERQQKVKEALYLFLLQKREEAEISKSFTSYNTRIIAPPYGGMRPTSPVRRNILLIAFALGLFIPIGVIFLKEATNSKINGRKDLENMTIPLLGEVPLWMPAKSKRSSAAIIKKTGNIAVKEAKRDIINEAFRVLRTNLEFMTNNDNGGCNTILFTSFNPGSGKSFLSVNTAMSLAIKKRNVLLIDGDLRHGTASHSFGTPSKGISDYLVGKVADFHDVIIKGQAHDYLSVLPVGTVPPNPTELLEEDKLSWMMDELKKEYDYIIIDCPPIEIVADAQIFNKYVDRTIFVVRAGLFEKSMLTILEGIYRDEKFTKMALVLNGSQFGGGYAGYSNRYGYKYGYRYGYGHKSAYGSYGKNYYVDEKNS